jgi:5'-nucleotidase (lipoprotein e(P4) family)
MQRLTGRLLLFLCSTGLAFPQTPHENLNAVVWVQTAAEYRASALQTYRAAEMNMMRAIEDKTWTAALEQKRPAPDLPLAVILDLDETVLDNSAFQARVTATGGVFSNETWQKWVEEKRAGLVPGAREFLLAAHAHGVAPFYVTNRVCDPSKADDPTVAVLRANHLPLRPERLLCRTDTGDKSQRRNLVAAGNRVLLLIGDDFNDFVSLTPAQSTIEGRFDAVDAYSRYWGERWFMLPNPTYGSWERTVGATVDAKRKALKH